jgi:excisionase family DNA binding protein
MSIIMMNTKEVAEYLDIHEKQVYALIKEKRIPCTRVTGKWLFPKHLIDEWIASSALLSVDLPQARQKNDGLLLAAGSNDPVLDVLLGTVNLKNYFGLFSTSTGSSEGLRLLTEKKVDIAWCHLFDPDTGSYNIPYLTDLETSLNIAVVHLFYRELGFVYSKALKSPVDSFESLTRKDVRFINRQKGSGTRLLLDYNLDKAGISNDKITGYANEVCTHFETGLAVSSGEADAGIATIATARIFGLPFTPIIRESFDMVLTKDIFFTQGVQFFIENLNSETFRKRISYLGNYDFNESGKIIHFSDMK